MISIRFIKGLIITIGTLLVSIRVDAQEVIIISPDSMVSTTYTNYESCRTSTAFSLRCPSYQQTTSYTCGSAVVMNLLLYYRKINHKDFNRQTELRIAKEMNATPGIDGGTTATQVISWLRSNDFSVSTGKDISSSMLIDYIKRGTPVIVSIDGHWIIAKGFADKDASAKGNHIIFSDSCCGSRTIASNYIDSIWTVGHMKNRYCGSSDGTYIIATPR